jgi:hypothetical protein
MADIGGAVVGGPGDPAATMDLQVLGSHVQLDLTGVPPDAAAQVRHLWRLCAAPPGRSTAGNTHVVTVSEVKRIGSADADRRADALMRLTQRVTGVAIEGQMGRSLMFHAGALARPETGASVVYVAPAGTGKTTLTRTLGPDFAYVTDETVAVTAEGGILPYPKPLSLRRTPHTGIKDETAPGDLGLQPPSRSPWVAGVVLLRRDRSRAGDLDVQTVDVLDAITALAPETSSLAQLDAPLRRLAELLDRTGGLRVVHYAEAGDLRPLFSDLMDGASCLA